MRSVVCICTFPKCTLKYLYPLPFLALGGKHTLSPNLGGGLIGRKWKKKFDCGGLFFVVVALFKKPLKTRKDFKKPSNFWKKGTLKFSSKNWSDDFTKLDGQRRKGGVKTYFILLSKRYGGKVRFMTYNKIAWNAVFSWQSLVKEMAPSSLVDDEIGLLLFLLPWTQFFCFFYFF